MQEPARRVDFAFVHQKPARDGADRAVENAHMAVRDEMRDPGILQEHGEKGQENGVVGTHKFDHGLTWRETRLHRKGRVRALSPSMTDLVMPFALAARRPPRYCPGNRMEDIVSLASPVGTVRPIASIDPILGLTRADMNRVNDMILAMAGSNVELIPEIADHLISSGGKRLRPMLTIASALLFGYEGEGHVKLAASVEFLHTATLLHDDVVDESDLRRGRKTARTIWGNQASVLVGDFLLGQAFKMMVEVGSMRALAILSNASAVIAEGEVWQLSAAKKMTTSEADYRAVIAAKTAELFAAAAEVGPVIAKSGDAAERAMRAYGMHLGMAFQLVDDVLDYGGSADDLGKNVGDDFREARSPCPSSSPMRRATRASASSGVRPWKKAATTTRRWRARARSCSAMARWKRPNSAPAKKAGWHRTLCRPCRPARRGTRWRRSWNSASTGFREARFAPALAPGRKMNKLA